MKEAPETLRLSPGARRRTRSAAGRDALLWRLAASPAHPFLLSAYAVFVLYARNLRETGFDDVAAPLACVLGLTLLLFLAFGAVLRKLGPRAALMTSTVVTGTLLYGDVLGWLNRLVGAGVTAASWPWILGGVALLCAAIACAPFRLTVANSVVNGIAVALFVAPAWKAASYEVQTLREKLASGGEIVGPASGQLPTGALAATPSAATKRPDIFYFIFDRYGSETTLKREFGFDNGPFLAFLREKGFYVASESRANYLKTAHSLASTFDMDYLNGLTGDPRTKRESWYPIYDMLEDHRVGRFLQARGYEYVQLGGWWGPTQHNRQADENYSYGFSEFAGHLLRRTMLPPVLNAAAPDSALARRLQWDNGQCRRIPAQFEKLKEIADRPETTFVFAHILLPHEPFVFDAEGNCVRPEQRRGQDFRTGYVGQVGYANRLIEDFVSHALAGEGQRPVIVIQADEGPFPERYRTGNRSWRAASRAELQMKTRILNAYYFPEGDYSGLYPAITPVNTFRTVFNMLFGTEFERLPDRVYAFPDIFKIYDFFDITDRVREPLD